MLILRDVLEKDAKFLSPTPGILSSVTEPVADTSEGPESTTGSAQSAKKRSSSSTDVDDLEAARLDKKWKPVAGWRDEKMVDSLLKALRTDLEGITLSANQELALKACFTPFIDGFGDKPGWQRNNSEADVSKSHSASFYYADLST